TDRSKSRSAFEVAMPHEHAMPEGRQASAQLLDQHDRAMPAAGAADRDGEVALALVLEAREREAQQLQHVLQELLRVGTLEDVRRHVGIGAGLGTELLR